MENGQRILDQVRVQLTELHAYLNEAVTQLKASDANDAGTLGQALGAAGNVVGLFATLATEPQLRAALDQAPKCQTLSGLNAPGSLTFQPPS